MPREAFEFQSMPIGETCLEKVYFWDDPFARRFGVRLGAYRSTLGIDWGGSCHPIDPPEPTVEPRDVLLLDIANRVLAVGGDRLTIHARGRRHSLPRTAKSEETFAHLVGAWFDGVGLVAARTIRSDREPNLSPGFMWVMLDLGSAAQPSPQLPETKAIGASHFE